MEPLLRETRLDQIIKESTERKTMECVCKPPPPSPYGGQQSWMRCNPMQQQQQPMGPNSSMYQQEAMQTRLQQQVQQQQQQLLPPLHIEDAIPTTFLPPTVSQPMPPPSFEQAASQNGPFNPFCAPMYPPGCPTPGLIGSYPGYQPPSNMPQPMTYQQEFCMQYPTGGYGGGNQYGQPR